MVDVDYNYKVLAVFLLYSMKQFEVRSLLLLHTC